MSCLSALACCAQTVTLTSALLQSLEGMKDSNPDYFQSEIDRLMQMQIRGELQLNVSAKAKLAELHQSAVQSRVAVITAARMAPNPVSDSPSNPNPNPVSQNMS